jgi:hypothetical protein
MKWKKLDGTRQLEDHRRERSEANCLTSGCKSRRRRSPCGAVVRSGSSRGNPKAGSPEVKALDGQVGTEPLRSGQHRGQATRRAVTKANGLNAEIGFPHEADSSGVLEMPRVSSLYSMASADAEEWGSARVGSPGGV